MKLVIFVVLSLLLFPIFSDVSIELEELNKPNVWSRQDKDGIVYYTKKDYGKVPVLCFHKIGDELRYSLTAEKFEEFLVYLNRNNFYVISDKDFIKRDFSSVPTGYNPIVLGSDDASEGNFLYRTIGDGETGSLDMSSGDAVIKPGTMVYLLEKYMEPVNGIRNFTFYISFNGLPFRQSGGESASGDFYRGYDIVKKKFNYLLDNFIVGVHTVTHPVTKNTSVEDFEWELNEFYSIMTSYVGDRVSMINTLAYPYGCADLKPEMRDMISNFRYNDITIIGGYDFNGYFSHSPFSGKVKDYDISRLGVDNKNIERVYGFLESVPLFKTQRVIVVKSMDDLKNIRYNKDDIIKVVE